MTTIFQSPSSYSIPIIRDIAQTKFTFPFPVEARNIINELMTSLHLPITEIPTEYKSSDLTLFTSAAYSASDSNERTHYRSGGGGSSRRQKTKEASEEEWNTIRTFQPTKTIAATTGYQSIIDMVRAQWNKTTDKTYAVSREKIFEHIIAGDALDATVEEKEKLAQTLYDIASNNQFFSSLYAELYAALLTQFDYLRPPLEKVIENHTALYDNFVYYSDDNYDQFCNMNKLNDRRRAQSCFIMNLGAVGYISPLKVAQILRHLVQKVTDRIQNAEYKTHVDEMTENIVVMYNAQLLSDAEDDDKYEEGDLDIISNTNQTITEAIQTLSKSSAKTSAGLSNKTIFKYMDLMDSLKK